MSKKMLALYGLKYNPFSPEAPTQDMFVAPEIDNFCWRITHQVGEGGFACITGDPGTGKSVALRILAQRLSARREILVGILTRPQAVVADLYRELGDIFGVTLSPHNRWAGAKTLREKWLAHIDASLYRPVLLIDEAQEMTNPAFSELRLLASANLDARSILTVVLAGDGRLTAKLSTPDLLPIGSRIRTRLRIEYATPAQLHKCLTHIMSQAGNPMLISTDLIATLCEHAAGNYRVLMNMANELLATALQRELEQIDEKLFFEVFALESKSSAPKKTQP
jgi:type II secretory pathway predicted ATPase ExeA